MQAPFRGRTWKRPLLDTVTQRSSRWLRLWLHGGRSGGEWPGHLGSTWQKRLTGRPVVDGQTLGQQTDASGWTDPWATDRCQWMDRPLGDRQMPVDEQTLGRQTDEVDGQTLVDRQTFGRQTDRRRWTDLRSTDRPSGDGLTFGQQTDRQAMERPSVNRQTVRRWTDLNRQTVRRWTDLRSTDRPSG